MFKRLLFAGLALVAPGFTLGAVRDILDGVFNIYLSIPNPTVFFIVASGGPAGIYTFLKVKPKNTMIEDIIVNHVKIMKAKQEAKLRELQGGK